VKAEKIRFFCDSCDTEVPGNAEKCPNCGKFFNSVRCPFCGYSGAVDNFKNGCPVCGRAAFAPENNRKLPKEKKNPLGDLPLWVYIVTGLAFITVMTALYFSFFR
jgi:RNA polymerase subunit RPABC4/transcription elongation factor Spt4